MKNNSEVLKRQGQKSFPPAACYSDMTNKSPSHHQSPGIKLETHTIDSDADAPQEKLGVDTDGDLSRMQRSSTPKGKTHRSKRSVYITPSSTDCGPLMTSILPFDHFVSKLINPFIRYVCCLAQEYWDFIKKVLPQAVWAGAIYNNQTESRLLRLKKAAEFFLYFCIHEMFPFQLCWTLSWSQQTAVWCSFSHSPFFTGQKIPRNVLVLDTTLEVEPRSFLWKLLSGVLKPKKLEANFHFIVQLTWRPIK